MCLIEWINYEIFQLNASEMQWWLKFWQLVMNIACYCNPSGTVFLLGLVNKQGGLWKRELALLQPGENDSSQAKQLWVNLLTGETRQYHILPNGTGDIFTHGNEWQILSSPSQCSWNRTNLYMVLFGFLYFIFKIKFTCWIRQNRKLFSPVQSQRVFVCVNLMRLWQHNFVIYLLNISVAWEHNI